MAKKPAAKKPEQADIAELRRLWGGGEKGKAAAFAKSLEKAGKDLDASEFPGLSDIYVRN